MLKKLSFLFLRPLTRSTPRSFSFSTEKQKPTDSSTQAEHLKAYKNQDNSYDDDEPQFEKENRSTFGWMIYRFFFWGSFSLLSYHLYLVSNHEKRTPIEDEHVVVPGFIHGAKHIHKWYLNFTQLITKPPTDKLLPDIMHPLMQPKTLVLNLSGTLINHDFIFGKGVNIKKRPGLNKFIKKAAMQYEVIIFSDDDSIFIESILPLLDPEQRMIAGYFGRQCMVLSGMRSYKDLKYLNRDLKSVIVIESNPKNVLRNKENVIVLSEFHGDQSDDELNKLGYLLQNLAKPEVRDVRKALEKLGQNPVESYYQHVKDSQQKIKDSKSNKFFGMLGKKN